MSKVLICNELFIYSQCKSEVSDQVKKLWGVDKNISFAKKTNADKWI